MAQNFINNLQAAKSLFGENKRQRLHQEVVTAAEAESPTGAALLNQEGNNLDQEDDYDNNFQVNLADESDEYDESDNESIICT